MADPLLVDTDPALGLFCRDIDDALAIWALWRAGVPLVGLTTVYGNAPLTDTHRIASALGARMGVPVFRGAAGPGERANEAVERLVAHRGAVLGLGPATNIAAALERGARWTRLVLLGGTARRGPNVRYLHLTELNFALDPLAASRALSACDLVVPMEVCRRVVFTGADLQGLPPDIQRDARSWVRIAPRLTGTAGFHPWDVLAAFAFIESDVLRIVPGPGAIHERRPWRGVLRDGGRRVPNVVDVDVARLRRRWAGLTGGPVAEPSR